MSDPGAGPPSLPPPGWYPDPLGSPRDRWWNGVTWTDDHRAAPDPSDGDSVGDWLGELFRAVGSRAGHLLAILMVTAVPLGLISAFSVWRLFEDFRLVIDDAADTIDVDGLAAGDATTLAVLAGVSILIGLVQYGAVSRQILATRFEPEPWSASIIGALRRAPQLLVVVVAMWLLFVVILAATILLTAAVPGAGGLLVVLAGLAVFVWVGARSGLVWSAAAVAPSIGRAFRSGVDASSNRLLALIGRFVLLITIVAFAQFAASSILNPLLGTGSIDPGRTIIDRETLFGTNVGAFAIVQVLSSVIGGFAGALLGGGLALLYHRWGGDVAPDIDRAQATDASTLANPT